MTDQLIQNPEYYRPCVGMMIINDAHKIFIARRKDLDDDAMYAWQMPQGGIDDGETPQQAVMREMIEETLTVYKGLYEKSLAEEQATNPQNPQGNQAQRHRQRARFPPEPPHPAPARTGR